MRRALGLGIAAILAVTLVSSIAGADERAQTVAAPDGSTYYVYTYGGPNFPTDHTMSIWQETNGKGASCAKIHEGGPAYDHKLAGQPAPATFSGLQITAGNCGGAYAADTKLSP